VTPKSAGAIDEVLMGMLRDLKKYLKPVPPFVVFQDPSLRHGLEISYFYELINIHGIGEGKGKKYGAEFVDLINRYVVDNEIIRPDDFVVKSTGTKSAMKLYIIQNVDRKLSLDDIAKAKGLTMEALLKEINCLFRN
jgi:ATP-dependent DNA helicase RecQ